MLFQAQRFPVFFFRQIITGNVSAGIERTKPERIGILCRKKKECRIHGEKFAANSFFICAIHIDAFRNIYFSYLKMQFFFLFHNWKINLLSFYYMKNQFLFLFIHGKLILLYFSCMKNKFYFPLHTWKINVNLRKKSIQWVYWKLNFLKFFPARRDILFMNIFAGFFLRVETFFSWQFFAVFSCLLTTWPQIERKPRPISFVKHTVA